MIKKDILNYNIYFSNKGGGLMSFIFLQKYNYNSYNSVSNIIIVFLKEHKTH